jgi:peroxidase
MSRNALHIGPRWLGETLSFLLSSWLIGINSAPADDLRGQTLPTISLLREFRPIGGVGNNLLHPNLNATPGTPEIATTPLYFGSGPGYPLVSGPNPRTVSDQISGGTDSEGDTASTTDSTLSAWLYVFGQFLDHDLDLEETPLTNPDCSIVIPPGDPNPLFTAGGLIEMNRCTRSPATNTIINTTAGYLDLSQLYGSDEATAASLRNSDGTLRSSNNGTALPIVGTAPNDYFITGDPRVMENPELTVVTILFMREHNFWVAKLKTQHPDWTADQLYNMAKAITTAEYQNIVYTEYLPALLGNVLGPYKGYNANVNAQVTQEFAEAAFRVGHSQVSDEQAGIDNTGAEVFSEDLATAFANDAAKDISDGIDPLIRSLGTDFSQATDVFCVDPLRNLLMAGLVGGGVDKIDLIAIDIQRERDAGVGTLNQTRRALGLAPYHAMSDLVSDPVLLKEFTALYGTVDQVDLFMGGLAEAHASGGNVGPTFQAIIARQFQALRAGDRFFWSNQGFDSQTALRIANTGLSDIIQRNTDTPNLQANVFIQRNFPIPPKQHPTAPWRVHNYPGHKRPFFTD